MNTQYFANQRLSEKLEKLGIESQFDFWWTYPESKERPYLFYGTEEAAKKITNHGELNKAYHWSDLCLQKNIGKIIDVSKLDRASGELSQKLQGFIYKITYRLPDKLPATRKLKDLGTWQSFVEQEVDKRFSERV